MEQIPELIARTWRYSGPVDELAFHDALADLLARHQILRTAEATFRYLALPTMGGFREIVSQQLTAAAIAEPCDAEEVSLRAHVVRFDKAGGIIILVAHAEKVDEWSMQLLMRDLAEFYEVRRTRAPQQASTLPPAHHLHPTASSLPTPTKSVFAFTRQPPEATDPSRSPGGAYRFHLSPDVVQRIRKQADDSHTTPHAVLLAAFKQLAQQHGASPDAVIATIDAGRSDPESHDTVGNFAHPVPTLSDATDTETGLVVPTFEFLDSPLLGVAGKAADLTYEEEFAAPNPDDDAPALPAGMRWTFAHPTPDVIIGTVRYRRADFSLEAVSALIDTFTGILEQRAPAD